MKALLAVTALAVVTGCAGTPAVKPVLSEKYDSSETAWSRESGTGSIKGAALVRTQDGEAKTCAASDVVLYPVSHHTMEFVSHVWGNTDRVALSYRPSAVGNIGDAQPNWPEIDKQMQALDKRSAICDVDGEFEFEDLPAGEYYVFAQVSWRYASYMGNAFAANHIDNTVVMQSTVIVDAGKTSKVVLR